MDELDYLGVQYGLALKWIRCLHLSSEVSCAELPCLNQAYITDSGYCAVGDIEDCCCLGTGPTCTSNLQRESIYLMSNMNHPMLFR